MLEIVCTKINNMKTVSLNANTCLYVRDGRVQCAGPVDQSLAPVDHSLIMHADKGLLDCIGKFLNRDTDIDMRMRNIFFFQISPRT